MEKLFDITQFDKYKEDNRREVKKANGGLPNDMWETYSAYANTYGGVIILDVKELDDKHWKTTGLKVTDKEKLLDNLWNLLHNPNKVNINLLSESDVEIYEVDEDIIIVIEVPMVKRSQKPVYINNDMFNQTFRRTYSGDYKFSIQFFRKSLGM
ncbi:MAG: ATP-binding protein [Anaerocolumna sp.]